MADSIKAKTIYGSVIAKCWRDANFQKRFLRDPKAVLKEEGLDIGNEMQVGVLEDTDKVKHVALPVDMDANHPDKDRLYAFLEKNFPLTDGKELRIVQNTDALRYVTIPLAAAATGAMALSDEELAKVAGGGTEATSTNTTQDVEAETTEVTVTETTEAQDTETTTTAVAEAEVAVVPGVIT